MTLLLLAIAWRIGFLLALCAPFFTQGYTSKKPPFLTSQDMCGIWRLSQKADLPLPSSLLDSTNADGDEEDVEDDIVLRLNEDGTFDPYTTLIVDEGKLSPDEGAPRDLRRILGRGGCWEYQDQSLLLAADRPEHFDPAKTHDTLLMGRLLVHVSECLMATDKKSPLDDEGSITKNDSSVIENIVASEDTDIDIAVHLSIPQGQISSGKFCYPKKHKAFFDQPMLFQPSNTGTFHMNQLLGNLNARLKSERDAATAKPEAKFHKRDFYNLTFYLTATPHPVDQGYAAQDLYYDETKAMLDIRVMPVTFYPNNTFSAIGTEKILRGRYGITGEKRDKLWFQVSLFGAGRSAPGSVYSEGPLLSQEDRRAYVGPIQAYQNSSNRTALFIDGEFCYGTKFVKANSMGSFTLQAMYDDKNDEEDDDYDLDSGSNDVAWDDMEDAFQ